MFSMFPVFLQKNQCDNSPWVLDFREFPAMIFDGNSPTLHPHPFPPLGPCPDNLNYRFAFHMHG